MDLNQLASYEIVSEIQRDALTVLYKAIELDSKKQVFLKEFKNKNIFSKENLLRVKKEFKILKKLKNPYILSFLASFEDEERLFIVNEYTAFKSLNQLIKIKEFKSDESAKIINNIALSLDYIHSHGIIYHDLKAENIYVDENLNIKLANLGSSLSLYLQKLDFNNQDQSSFYYMAPEQSGILKREPDHRSDLYSLGILFYRLLTKQFPFKEESSSKLLHDHIAKKAKEPLFFVKNLSPILNKMVLKLISKDPDERYQSAFGLSEDLKIYLGLKDELKKSFYLELGKKDRLKYLNYNPPLVGRQKELNSLLDLVNKTLLKKASLNFITGKRGLGKTKLLFELQKNSTSKKVRFVSVKSTQKGADEAYSPFINAANSLFEALDKMEIEQKNKLEIEIKKLFEEDYYDFISLLPYLSSIFFQSENEGKTNKLKSESISGKLSKFFQLFSMLSAPVIFIFDDAQYWNQSKLDFLIQLYEKSKNSSLAFIVVVENDEPEQQSFLNSLLKEHLKKENINHIHLRELSIQEIEEIILGIFVTVKGDVLKLGTLLHKYTEGNPFLVKENIKLLVEKNVITLSRNKWKIEEVALENFNFSLDLQERILSRLQKVSAKNLEILKYASVLGAEFEFETLRAFLKSNAIEISDEKLLNGILEAKKEKILEENLSKEALTFYRFTKSELLEALEKQFNEDELKNLHKKAAQLLENEGIENNKVKLFQLAEHYLLSKEQELAYDYNIKAAALAKESNLLDVELKYLIKSYNILKTMLKEQRNCEFSEKDQIDLVIKIARSSGYVATDYQKVLPILLESIEVARKLKDRLNEGILYYYVGRIYYLSSNQHEALEYYSKLIPIAEELDLEDYLPIVYCIVGRVNCYLGNFKDGIEYLNKGIELIKDKEGIEYVLSKGALAQGYILTANKEKAYKILEEFKTLRANISKELNAFTFFYEGYVRCHAGELEKALQLSFKAYEESKVLKNPTLEDQSIFLSGRVYLSLKQFEKAFQKISLAISATKKNGHSFGLYNMYLELAKTQVLLDDTEGAEKSLKQAAVYKLKTNDQFAAVWEAQTRAFILLFSKPQKLNKALKVIDSSLVILSQMPALYDAYYYQSIFIKACILWKSGNRKETLILYQQSRDFFKQKGLLRFYKEMEFIKDKVLLDNKSSFKFLAEQRAFSYERQMYSLVKLSEQLAKEYELFKLLPKIIDLAIEVSGAEAGYLFLYQQSVKSSKEHKIELKLYQKEGDSQKAIYSKQILDKTLDTKRAQLIDNAQEQLEGKLSENEGKMKSIMTVPLIVSDALIGAIYLKNDQVKGLFTQESFEFLKLFATEAAIFIENTKLSEKLQEKARIEQELLIAKDIQNSILPPTLNVKGYDLAAFMKSATEVGGDYYDFFLEEAPFFGIFGDVAGHGIKSGLIMMMGEVAFNMLMIDKSIREEPLTKIYQKLNLLLYKNIQSRLAVKSSMALQYSIMYMTCHLFRFDEFGNFEIFGSDHASPFICKAETGEIIPIKSSGFLLGIAKDAVSNFTSIEFKLEKDDLFVLYSDGITEAKNKRREAALPNIEREMFGEQRFFKIIQENRFKKPAEIIEKLEGQLNLWMEEQEDDITISILKKI